MDNLQTRSSAVEPLSIGGPAFSLVASRDQSQLRPESGMVPPGNPSFAAQMARAASEPWVVIGAGSPVLLCGLRTLVSETIGVRLAGSADSLSKLLECCTRIPDGVALVDPFLGGQNIRRFMETLHATAPKIRAVLIAEGLQAHGVREAVMSGACGFVATTAHAQEIRAAIAAASEGRRYISAVSAARLADSLAQEDLTQRETQVLGLLARGECNKEIARSLDVSLGTVKTHVRAIMSKLGSRSRTEAVHKAYRLGLVGLDA